MSRTSGPPPFVEVLETPLAAVAVPAAIALRWMFDGRHRLAGAVGAAGAWGAGVTIGVILTPADQRLWYAAQAAFISIVVLYELAIEGTRIDAAGPDRLVSPSTTMRWIRVASGINLLLAAWQQVSGRPEFPRWAFSFDIVFVVCTYLMYLPESPFGRRSFVARLTDRLGQHRSVAPTMA